MDAECPLPFKRQPTEIRIRGMLSHKTGQKGNIMYPQSVPIGIEWNVVGWCGTTRSSPARRENPPEPVYTRVYSVQST